jgi:hypothetical protein
MDTPLPQDLGQAIQNARFPVAVNQPKNAFRQAIQTQGGGGLSQQAMRDQQAARLATASAAGTGDVLQAYRAKRATAQSANEAMNLTMAHSNEERAFAEQQVNDQIAQYRETKMRQLEQMRQGIREMQAKVADSLDKMGQDFQYGQEQQAIGGAIGTAFGSVQGGIQAHDYYNPNPDIAQTRDLNAEMLGTYDTLGAWRNMTEIPNFDAPYEAQRNAEMGPPSYLSPQQQVQQPIANPVSRYPNLTQQEYSTARETPAMQMSRLRGLNNLRQDHTDPRGALWSRYGRRR